MHPDEMPSRLAPTVLVTRRLPEPALARLRETCRVVLNPHDRPMTRAELLEEVKGRDALLCMLTDTVDGPLLDAAGAPLRVVANYGVGYNNIDVAAATARRVPVTNTPGVLTEATADLTWALILDTVRRVTEGDRVMRAGRFPGVSPLYMLSGDVSGATLGLFGMGRIGRAVARRARGFGVRILYHQRNRLDEAAEREVDAAFVDFDTLLRESDILSIHAPLTPETTHRFGRSELARMKRTATLINTSRGPVIREADLVAALRDGTIAGAGLDVYEHEPETADGLAGCESAVLAPHLGSATRATRTNMGLLAADNVVAVLAGRRPPACINPEVLG